MPQTHTLLPTSQTVTIGGRQCVGITHAGLTRQANADRHLIRSLGQDDGFLALADGMGDTPAAACAADKVLLHIDSIAHIPFGQECTTLDRIARQADRVLSAWSRHEPDFDGTGSTLVAVLLRGKRAYWVHVGDSRLYLFRNSLTRQVTRDQTLARFLVAEKEITPAQAAVHYSRHVMDQYIGCGFAEPETGELCLLPSDLLVLTSDGLHHLVSEQALCHILDTSVDLADKGRVLVQAALAEGGTDNVTAVLCRI